MFLLVRSEGVPYSLFLNSLLNYFEGDTAAIGTALFAVFSLYLMWCSTNGSFTLGLRFFLFTFYPMKYEI